MQQLTGTGISAALAIVEIATQLAYDKISVAICSN
jgi:hypothetical protein